MYGDGVVYDDGGVSWTCGRSSPWTDHNDLVFYVEFDGLVYYNNDVYWDSCGYRYSKKYPCNGQAAFWWLRSPRTDYDGGVYYVTDDGDVIGFNDNFNVDWDSCGRSSPDFVHGYLAWYTCIVGDTGVVSNNDVDDVYYNSCGNLSDCRHR